MRTSFRIALLTAGVATSIVLAGCPSPIDSEDSERGPVEEPSGPGDIPQSFWGSWVRMDQQDEVWYFSDAEVSVGSSESRAGKVNESTVRAGNRTITLRSPNVLAVQPTDGLEYFLFRERGATASVQSKVRDSAVGTRSVLAGLAGIEVVISNRANPVDTQVVESGADGKITFSDVIPGDQYTVSVSEQPGVSESFDVPIVPQFDGEDVGAVIVSEADQNFKVSYTVTDASAWDYMYVDSGYTLGLVITNLGAEDMLSADYKIEVPPGLTLAGSGLNGILGTVESDGGSQTLWFDVTSESISEDYVDYIVPVSITSVDGLNRWDDNISIRFFRTPMEVYFRTDEAAIEGIIITPEQRSLPFSGRDDELTVPARSRPYTVAVTGADYESETAYTFRLGARPTTDGSQLETATINEPNNDETQRTPANLGQELVGYLGVRDLDFYELRAFLDEGADIPWNWPEISNMDEIVAYAGYELSWDAIWGVEYELQLSEDSFGFSSPTTVSLTDPHYTVNASDLSGADTIYARVRAVDRVVSSAWSETLTMSVWSGELGDVGPAGGIVFYDRGAYTESSYDYEDAWRYLEVAPADASMSAQWGGYGVDTIGRELGGAFEFGPSHEPIDAVGAGARNTFSHIRWLGGGVHAASSADDYSAGGFSDWFLPSWDEADALFDNKTAAMGLADAYYWTSSTGPFADWDEEALMKHMGDGTDLITDRNQAARVRAVRAF